MYRDPYTRKDGGEAGLYNGVKAAAGIEIVACTGGIGSSEAYRSGERRSDRCVWHRCVHRKGMGRLNEQEDEER